MTDRPADPPQVTSVGLLPLPGWEFSKPKLPSVSTGIVPAPAWLKSPLPTLLGNWPAIRLPWVTVQVGIKDEVPLIPVCAAMEVIILFTAAETLFTFSELGALTVAPGTLDAR